MRGPANEAQGAFVSREDAARTAAAVLANPSGGTHDVTGPEALSLADVACRFSTMIGRQLCYQPESVESARDRLNKREPASWRVDLSVGWFEAIAAGELEHASDTVLRFTGKEPLKLKDYFILFPELLQPLRQPQDPVLQYNFNWKSLSVAAGLTLWNFYFRLYTGSVKKAQVVDFLQALVRHLRLPLLVVWDRLPAHRSHLVQDYIASLEGWIHSAYLPPYAPELNPVEFIWAHWKQDELPNVCPQDYYQLSEAARRTLRRMRRRPRLITAFWHQASLWPE
jgi:transposase